jgi:thiamine pyrophosphate-dependent acetolactate synthase large subunit-like protein
MGLFEGEPFDLGIVGSLGTNLGVALAGRADVVLAVGASLNDFTTVKGTLFSDKAKIIRCDLRDDPSPNRYQEDLLLIGDAKIVIGQLLEMIPVSTAREGYRTAEVAQSLRDSGITTEFVDKSEQGRMDPRTLMMLLNCLLPKNRQVVTDVGHFFGFPATYLKLGGGGRYMAAVEFGAVGSGLGVAIGAAMARPDLTTVLFLGDGGLLMSLSDLSTAARAGANLVIIVVNDGAYGSELQMLRNWKLPEDAAVLEQLDIAAVSGALGLRTFSVRAATDLHAPEGKISPSEGPILIDCHITQNVVAGWLEGAFVH